MYYINTDCTYTKIAIEQLLREKYFDDKCHCNNIKIYDLRFLKIEDVAYRLIQLFKERIKVSIIFICSDRFIHSKEKPRNIFFLDTKDSMRIWTRYLKKIRYCNSNLLICFLYLCSLYHISVFTGKRQVIIACIKKGFSFSEIVNFLNINTRTLVNYIGGLTTYFFLPYSYSLYTYIKDNIIVSFYKEYHILLTNQRRYYV